MNIQSIPLTKLVPSASNVRKTGAKLNIEELAASIAAHGLLQNLQVKPFNGSGTFEVVAGGRRLKALRLLAKQKQIKKSFKVTCNVLTDESATEISLAENIIRMPMHPADQFDAFRKMALEGKGDEEIAARFGCTAATVRQRLKLANVSPVLIKAYRAEQLSLDALMAFTVSDDHKAQEECWNALPEWNRQPQPIRRALTAAHIETTNRFAVFAGVKTYVAAGGAIVRDLFQPEHEGWLTDRALLDRLVAARLEREAEAVRAEGWTWIEIVPDTDWETLRSFVRIQPKQCALSKKDSAKLERLAAQYDELAEDGNTTPAFLAELAEQIDALQAKECVWLPEALAQSGAIVSVGDDGRLSVERGLVKLADRKACGGDAGAEELEQTVDAKPKPSGLSGALIEELTAHRTAALQTLLADNPKTAMAALAHTLALPVFYDAFRETCITIRGNDINVTRSGPTVKDGSAYQSFHARQEDWKKRLPAEAADLWPWLLEQDEATVTALLAVCAAASVNAVQKPHDSAGAERLADAERLAAALKLEMSRWWQPTSATYLSRVSKSRALEAVTEACGKQASDNLSSLKKDALAARAETLLADKGWLPELLRKAS
jgi:ParB family chromosome partitioning protein